MVFYPIGILIFFELLMGSQDDDDDDRGGGIAAVYQERNVSHSIHISSCTLHRIGCR